MKKLFWSLTLLFVALGSLLTSTAFYAPTPTRPGVNIPAQKDDADGIQFTDASWSAILKKAKAEKKVIFLDAYASWCGPCKMLQKRVFTQKSVGDFYNGRFINVKMDMEKGEGPALAQVYPLVGYPTLLFIDGNGRVVKKAMGYMSAQELIAIGKSVSRNL